MSNRENLLADRQAAMPEVKKLIKNHGRSAIVWCLNQLKEYEKKMRQLADLRKAAAALEKEIR